MISPQNSAVTSCMCAVLGVMPSVTHLSRRQNGNKSKKKKKKYDESVNNARWLEAFLVTMCTAILQHYKM